VCLSDLFAEREQFDWMLDTLFEVYKLLSVDDEISLQYLNVGLCKAAAVVAVVSTVKSTYKEPAYKKLLKKTSGYKELIFIPQSLLRN